MEKTRTKTKKDEYSRKEKKNVDSKAIKMAKKLSVTRSILLLQWLVYDLDSPKVLP